MKKIIFFGAAILFFALLSGNAVGDTGRIGFVKKGAFVVPAEVNAKLRKHQTRLRIGYLPVGTVVWVGDCMPLNENASSGIPNEKIYCAASSEVGVNGLIRQDLIHFFSSPVIVALANEKISVYPIDGGTPYSNFSRNSGIYVDVIGPISNGEIPVMRHYTKPEPIPGVLKIDQLGDKVRYLDPDNLRVERAKIQNLTHFTEDVISSRFGSDIKTYFLKIRGAIKKLEDKIHQPQNSLCLIGGDIFAEVGLNFFGSGAGAKIEATLKNPGETFGFDAAVLTIGNERTFIASISRYACTSPPDPVPEWLMEFLSVGAPQRNPKELLRVKGHRENEALYVVPDNPKMLKVYQWEDYERQYNTLRREVRQQSFAKSMKTQEASVYIHYILSKVADFQDN